MKEPNKSRVLNDERRIFVDVFQENEIKEYLKSNLTIELSDYYNDNNDHNLKISLFISGERIDYDYFNIEDLNRNY